MKNNIKLTTLIIIFICSTLIFNHAVFASDDTPYLTEDDVAALEATLPEDLPEILLEIEPYLEYEEIVSNIGTEGNEISRLNTSREIYHFIILDRRLCSPNADIIVTENMKVLYKFIHRANGYLIALYTSPANGPVFPQLPDGSYLLVNLTTVRKNSIVEYLNSPAFKKFVTNRTITSELIKAIRAN